MKEDGHTQKEHQETRDFLVESFVRHILFGKQEIGKVERELKELMSLLDFQLDSMPGIELVTASTLIAEIGDVSRFPNANKFARFAGIAPVLFTLALVGKERNIKANREIGRCTLYLQPRSPTSASSKRK